MKSLKLSLLMALAILFVNCDNDDDAGPVGPVNPDSKLYTLNEVGDSGVSGMALFEDQQNGTTKITLELDGTPSKIGRYTFQWYTSLTHSHEFRSRGRGYINFS